jgi:septum formation protein
MKVNDYAFFVELSNRVVFLKVPFSTHLILLFTCTGEVLNCAGGLMVEHPLVLPFRRKIEGTEESVMGLSVELLHSLLEELNALKMSKLGL